MSFNIYMGHIVFTSVRLPCGGVLVYVCILDQAPILDYDEIDLSTQVYTIRHTWAPTVMTHLARQ
jgi:hypothetical protein